jgi:S-phase kinase-associated protein 1
MSIVQLFTGDGSVFYVGENVAKQSKTIADLIEEVGVDGIDDPIPIPNVSPEILDIILNFCEFNLEYHPKDDIEEFDSKFFDIECKRLLEIVSAANFLNIPDLLDKSCSAIASLLCGKTPSELREILDVKTEYTKEEKEAVMKENRWAFPDTHVFYP